MHLKTIDKEHNITGAVGFLKLPGKFSSHFDRTLDMNHQSFYKMNINYQRKWIQNIVNDFNLQNINKPIKSKNKVSSHLNNQVRASSNISTYPKIADLIQAPGKSQRHKFL